MSNQLFILLVNWMFVIWTQLQYNVAVTVKVNIKSLSYKNYICSQISAPTWYQMFKIEIIFADLTLEQLQQLLW